MQRISRPSRRAVLKTFATALAAPWAAARTGLGAEAPAAAPRPRVAVVYFRKAQGGGCVWPPSSTEELATTQQLLNKLMQDAAAKHGVDLTILAERVTDVKAALEGVQQAKPDGLIVIAMDFNLAPMVQFCQGRGDIPAIVYGNIVHMGRSFEPLRRMPRTLFAHTPDVKWLETAIRMHRALWDLSRLKLLDCPCPGYYEELKKVAVSDELKAIADSY
ncbi:MAG: hypothetical protein FJ290_27360, partial [Planctomycetes bacterium]|nr:hypothetical protein [Planctomycetota bacterium]